ncbi:MAG TPA: radical SAM protein [Anaerolineae bacterium]|nr:radical SAM protein [Anaerolineae bacterium]HNU03766.1 radical SAM protein [Anaerolineae bacterium]
MSTIKPVKIRLEASSACQLRCPSCPTAQGIIGKSAVGTGLLKFDDFKALIDQNPGLREIGLSNWGEVLLNPQLVEILAYAHAHNVRINLANGVNLNTASDEALEALVKYGVQEITVSIDGASQETYQQYRVRGNFDTVIGNVRKINAYKQQYGSQAPRLNWQFVIFGHNEHEINRVKALCQELNMTFRPKLNWDADFSPVRNKQQVMLDAGLAATTRQDDWEQTHKFQQCLQLWNEPQINWDGKVLGCCVNYWQDFGGNVFGDGLEAAVNNEQISYAREMLMGKAPARDDIPCTSCTKYQRMAAEQVWIKQSDVVMDRGWMVRLRRFPWVYRAARRVVNGLG